MQIKRRHMEEHHTRECATELLYDTEKRGAIGAGGVDNKSARRFSCRKMSQRNHAGFVRIHVQYSDIPAFKPQIEKFL